MPAGSIFQDGFLGYRSSFMLDFVVVSLLLVVPILLYSLFAVKVQRKYALHRNLQILLGVVLLVAVGAFEVDLHLIQGGWRQVIAKQTPALTEAQIAWVQTVLRIHLIFAISTPILWAITLTLALRKFPHPVTPSTHSPVHKLLGWLSTVDITLTSVTGLWFYYTAFVAH